MKNIRMAILMTGNLRSFKETSESFNKFILKPHNPDIFIHTWDKYNILTPNAFSSMNEYLNKKKIIYEGYSNKIDINIIDSLNPKKVVIENWEDVEPGLIQEEKYYTRKQHPSDTPSITLSMFRQLYLCNELKKKYENENNFKYDIVLRVRPDIQYTKDFITPELNDDGTLDLDLIYTSLHSHYGTISDITAYSSSVNMDKYCNLFNNIKYIYDNMILFQYVDAPYSKKGNRSYVATSKMSPGLGMNPHLLLLHHIFTEKLEYIIHDTGIELVKWDPKKHH